MGIVDQRKLFLFSRYSLALLLPKIWLKELGAERGELVTLNLDRKRGRIVLQFNAKDSPADAIETPILLSQDGLEPIPQLDS